MAILLLRITALSRQNLFKLQAGSTLYADLAAVLAGCLQKSIDASSITS